ADSVDIRRRKQNEQDEKRAFDICSERIRRHGLDMKLVDAEYTLDRAKLLFYFTADGRVDFRDLVKDLAGVFHTRIELRQIGVRDEAKMTGGLGVCGQPFCCSRFLRDFQPVSIKMAKEQGLSLNPTKISGACGRLMCCLAYEQPAYEYLSVITPGVTSYVKTPDEDGTVCEVNLISGQIKHRLDSAPQMPKTYHRDQIIILRAATKKAGKRKPQSAARQAAAARAKQEHAAQKPAAPKNAPSKNAEPKNPPQAVSAPSVADPSAENQAPGGEN